MTSDSDQVSSDYRNASDTLNDVFILHSHYIRYVTALPVMSERVASNYLVMLPKDMVNTVIRSQTVTHGHSKYSIFDLIKVSRLLGHKCRKNVENN